MKCLPVTAIPAALKLVKDAVVLIQRAEFTAKVFMDLKQHITKTKYPLEKCLHVFGYRVSLKDCLQFTQYLVFCPSTHAFFFFLNLSE